MQKDFPLLKLASLSKLLFPLLLLTSKGDNVWPEEAGSMECLKTENDDEITRIAMRRYALSQ